MNRKCKARHLGIMGGGGIQWREVAVALVVLLGLPGAAPGFDGSPAALLAGQALPVPLPLERPTPKPSAGEVPPALALVPLTPVPQTVVPELPESPEALESVAPIAPRGAAPLAAPPGGAAPSEGAGRPFPVPGSPVDPSPPGSGRGFGSLLELAGYRVTMVAEGLLPVPRYCVALERIGRRTPQEQAAAEREIARHFARPDLSWYDLWTHAQKLILDTLIDAERFPSRWAALFDARLVRVEVGVLPVPWAREILLPVPADGTPARPAGSTDQADLITDLGYQLVRVEESWTLAGRATTVVLRRRERLSEFRRQDVLARISGWLSGRPRTSLAEAYWETVFFTLLRWIETDSLGFGWMRDTVLDDLAITLAVVPGASLRRRPEGAGPLGDAMVPCS